MTFFRCADRRRLRAVMGFSGEVFHGEVVDAGDGFVGCDLRDVRIGIEVNVLRLFDVITILLT
jgi:hypothetical protein